jgi:phytoene desaturase
MKTVIIIGSGIGGLASAIRFRNKGYKVIVLEKNNYVGGKLTELQLNKFRFDAGPSLFTMPELVTELFELSSKNVTDYFEYSKLTTICKYFYEDGTIITADGNVDKFAEEVAAKTTDSKTAVLKHLEKSEFIYNTTSELFLTKSLHKLSSYLSLSTFWSLLKFPFLNPLKTMNGVNSTRFKDSKSQRLFNRYATYNGSNPYKAPAILNIIPHLEYNRGAYYPKGGMISITNSLHQLALDLGVEFRLNSNVYRINVEKGKVTGVSFNNENILADIVVSNVDIKTVYDKLLPTKKELVKVQKQERSCSALIFYWGINKTFSNLDVHNIFFTENYKDEFKYLFGKASIYEDPTVYVNITSKYSSGDAPENCETWFVMINVPPNFSQDWDVLIKEARQSIIDKLNRVLKIDLESLIIEEDMLTPKLIESKTSSYRGSLYGTASNDRLAAFFRHSNFSKTYKGLYFCGGSVHPGGGIPLALSSAKIIDKYIKHV